MIVDFHTHNLKNKAYPAIVNIPLDNTHKVLNNELLGIFSAGIHPFDIAQINQEMWYILENCIADKRFVALGECGLDKNCIISIETQKEIFSKQILISENYKKPLIIHCAGMYNELLIMKKQLKPAQLWIIHGYRGKPELAIQLMKAGIMLSFGEKFNVESVKITPADKIFIETDESLVSIHEIYKNIANIKQCSLSDLIAGTDFYEKFI